MGRHWYKRLVKTFLLVATTLVALVLALAGVTWWQAESYLSRTTAWKERWVGAVEISAGDSNSAESPAETLEALTSLAVLPRKEEREAVAVLANHYYGFGRASSHASGEQDSDLESAANQVRTVLNNKELQGHFNALAELESIELGLKSATQMPEWSYDAITPARLRLVEIGLDLEAGDCAEASAKTVALERMAATLASQANLAVYMIGGLVEAFFLESWQEVVEHQLGGHCTSSAAAVDHYAEATGHLDRHRVSVSAAFAREAELTPQMTRELAAEMGDTEAESYLEFFEGLSGWQLGWSGLWFEARQAEEPDLGIEPPPRMPFLVRRLTRVGIMSDMLTPNLLSAIEKGAVRRAGRDLTDAAVALLVCESSEGCDLAAAVSTLPQSELLDEVKVPRERELLTLDLELQTSLSAVPR